MPSCPSLNGRALQAIGRLRLVDVDGDTVDDDDDTVDKVAKIR